VSGLGAWKPTYAGELYRPKPEPVKDPAEVAFRQALGARIKQARVNAGWSVKDLAVELGLSHPAISNVEAGRHPISLYKVVLVAELLGADPHVVLLGSR